MSETRFMGEIQVFLTTHEAIFIPFVCKRCGRCCREVSIDQGYFNPFEIASFLKLSVREVVEKYLGELTHLDEKEVKWKANRPMKPCPFLEGNRCVIYPVRPGPCRSYPLFTDFGDSGIGCPGMLEMRRAEKNIGMEIPYYTSPYIADEPPRVRVRPERWMKTLQKYVKTHPSREALDIFIQVNEPKPRGQNRREENVRTLDSLLQRCEGHRSRGER